MGGFPEYEGYDGLGLAELVRSKQVKPSEVLEAAIERAEERNPVLNAIVLPMYEEARAAAIRGLSEGPLTGVPFLLKDLHALYSGRPTANGCRLFADAVADHDSEIVVRQRRAGLVIFGKTNTPELGLSVTTEPRLFGATRNPWSLEHSPGGSSGGAAAAVAAGIVPLAHATDGGGSIRIPASCCGIFGMKPTRARIPLGPDQGEGWSGMSVHHAVSRSVRDSAALLDATSGAGSGDPYAAPAQPGPFLAEVGADPGRLRIALSVVPPSGVAVDPECLRAARDAALLCETLGHEVSEATPEIDGSLLARSTAQIIAASTRSTLDLRASQLGRTLSADDVERGTWTLAQMGSSISGADYVAAVRSIHGLGRQLAGFFESYDVLLTPTAARPPLLLGELDTMSEDFGTYLATLGSFRGFPELFNATGQPAMSVPLHWTPEGLPVGVQFAGRFGAEATLFRLAAQLEQAAPWADRRPPALR